MCTVSSIWKFFGKFLSNSKSYLNGLVIAFTTFRLSRSAVSSSFPVLTTWFEWKSIKKPEIKFGLCTLKSRSWRTCDHPAQFHSPIFSQDYSFDTFYFPFKELYISLKLWNNWISIIERFQNSNFYQFRID